jgi:hypothetical protein
MDCLYPEVSLKFYYIAYLTNPKQSSDIQFRGDIFLIAIYCDIYADSH